MENDLKRIVSFDPASQRNVGWGLCEVLCKDGLTSIITCEADAFVIDEFENRWSCYWPMFQKFEGFLLEHVPDVLVIEKTNAFAGGFVTGQVSQCMGTIFAAAGKCGIKDIFFVYPTSVKKLIAGHGKATKSQIKHAVESIAKNTNYGEIKFSSEHAYDSISNIFYYMISEGYIKELESFPWLSEKQLKLRNKTNGKKVKK